MHPGPRIQNQVSALIGQESPGSHVADANVIPGHERRYEANSVKERKRVDEPEYVADEQGADTRRPSVPSHDVDARDTLSRRASV